MAIAGFVCSFFCSVLGLIFSIIGHNECKRSGGTVGGAGLALAGIIISSITLALSVLGMITVISIPAFMEYMHRSKRTEPELKLRQLERAVEQYAVVNNALPRASAPLTPATSCCDAPGHKCFDLESWQTPAWKELDFEVQEPHRFQYSYESDGKKFLGRAVGDLDCDGSSISYEITGVLGEAGRVTFSKRGPIGAD
jgi:Tfp pilus assembly protein PilE